MVASRRKGSAIAAAFGALLAIAAAAAPASAQPSGKIGAGVAAATVDRDFIVGAWTDSDDCAAAVAFAGDGTFLTAEGGEGMWDLEGADLILSGAGGVRTLQVIPVDPDTMDVVNEDGSRGRSTRCDGSDGSDVRDPNYVARNIA